MNVYVLAGTLLLMPLRPLLAQTSLEATRREILREGLALYTSERASWVATDLLQAHSYDTRQIRSYFSYCVGDSVHTVFVGGPVAVPRVLLAYSFGGSQIEAAAARRSGSRPLTARESHLLTIRDNSMKDLPRIDGFEVPTHTALNPVLLEKDRETWVYVLTGSRQPGTVPLGNDYLLRYDAAGQLRYRVKLHRSFIAIGRAPAGQTVTATLHTHLPGTAPFITPTDICTLLLYRQQLPGQRHVVLGEKYVSVFVPAAASLTLLTRKAFDRQQQRP